MQPAMPGMTGGKTGASNPGQMTPYGQNGALPIEQQNTGGGSMYPGGWGPPQTPGGGTGSMNIGAPLENYGLSTLAANVQHIGPPPAQPNMGGGKMAGGGAMPQGNRGFVGQQGGMPLNPAGMGYMGAQGTMVNPNAGGYSPRQNEISSPGLGAGIRDNSPVIGTRLGM